MILFEKNTVLFDLDDTIHDRNRTLQKFLKSLLQRYYMGTDPDTGLKISRLFTSLDNRGYCKRDEVFTELISRFPMQGNPGLHELINFWNKGFPLCAEPVPGVFGVFDELKNMHIKMGIVTNGVTAFQNTKIDTLGFRKYMNTIIISDEIHIRKPDPKIFHFALEQIGSRPENTIFVGDNPATDIKGAIAAGLISVWLSDGQAWKETEYAPQYIIKDITALVKSDADNIS